jgi:hypothetical protein
VADLQPIGYFGCQGEGKDTMRTLIGIVIVAWLVIGALAAAQRGYFGNDRDVNCKTFSDTALTVVAGPLNYVGVNPKVKCKTPQPSK